MNTVLDVKHLDMQAGALLYKELDKFSYGEMIKMINKEVVAVAAVYDNKDVDTEYEIRELIMSMCALAAEFIKKVPMITDGDEDRTCDPFILFGLIGSMMATLSSQKTTFDHDIAHGPQSLRDHLTHNEKAVRAIHMAAHHKRYSEYPTMITQSTEAGVRRISTAVVDHIIRDIEARGRKG